MVRSLCSLCSLWLFVWVGFPLRLPANLGFALLWSFVPIGRLFIVLHVCFS